MMKTIPKNQLYRLLGLLSRQDDVVFLDTAKPDSENTRSMFFWHPVRRLRYYQGQGIADFLADIQKAQAEGHHVAGWIGYEFGYEIEAALAGLLCRPGDTGALLADLGVYAEQYTFDHGSGACDFPKMPDEVSLSSSYSVSNLAPSQTRDDYVSALERVLDYIRAGDTYQVNYTLKLLFDFSGSVEAFYLALRRNQSVAYGAYIRSGKRCVLSFSPELFFKKGPGSITVRPMKGTVKRGKTPVEDAARALWLAEDLKNRSENVMIVDLLRNDLGRLMHRIGAGDVGVNSLFDVEAFETLQQMTSTITASAAAKTLEQIPLLDVFVSLFPCGSVTGAPKIRTMQIIDELEKDRRGVYTGAIGYFAPNGEAMFNVPIRTVVLDGTRGEMGIGSGIVSDSDPEQEWRECLLKGHFLTEPAAEFQLIETLLYHPDDGYLLLAQHLQRLASSADYFFFSRDSAAIEAGLAEHGERLNGGCHRVRLCLEKDGTFTIGSSPCDRPRSLRLPDRQTCGDLPAVAFSTTRTDPQAVWFYHKTTRRDLYDREFAAGRDRGLFDVCFCNSDGEVTEGCITNIIALKDGAFVTPPLRCGLLPGVMRGVLLADGERPLVEEVLTMEDVRSADALFLCNSVRGVVQVRLIDD